MLFTNLFECSVGVESQNIDDMDTFVIETLKHRRCRVVHTTLVDTADISLTRHLVFCKPVWLFP